MWTMPILVPCTFGCRSRTSSAWHRRTHRRRRRQRRTRSHRARRGGGLGGGGERDGSARVIDYVGVGELIVPALALIVHQHPEEAQAERNGREPVAQVAQQRAPNRQRLAVRPRDAHAHEQLSWRLAEQDPEDDGIADSNSDADERG